jgi:hypothetical protein
MSARTEGPELFYLVGGLGKTKILTRIDRAAEFVAAHGDMAGIGGAVREGSARGAELGRGATPEAEGKVE